MTPSGIEPATFRFVTQHLNHCATKVKQGTLTLRLKQRYVIGRKVLSQILFFAI